MAFETTSYTPLQFIAGDADIRVKDVLTLANAAIIPALTPMKRDANNKAIPATAITDKIIGLTVPRSGSQNAALTGEPISATDTYVPVYTNGDIFASQINWASITAITGVTAADYAKMDQTFDSTGINLKFPSAGQV
jgi:hypothetical protein